MALAKMLCFANALTSLEGIIYTSYTRFTRDCILRETKIKAVLWSYQYSHWKTASWWVYFTEATLKQIKLDVQMSRNGHLKSDQRKKKKDNNKNNFLK